MSQFSFLRWAGSKSKLIPELKNYWRLDSCRYIEPFMGSAKLFFEINPQSAILSDTNKYLTEVFIQIKKNPYAVYEVLKDYKPNKDFYYQLRAINPESLGINQRVARFIFLNKLCFNGLYRTNMKGEFNVPYSEETFFDIRSEYENLKMVSKKLQNTSIYCADFETIIKRHVKENDFVYLDPPYAVSNRRIFKQYGPHTFGLSDLERLQVSLYYINEIGAKFLLSYAYCKESLAFFSGWKMEKVFTQRNIAGFSKYRRKAAEVLISNI